MQTVVVDDNEDLRYLLAKVLELRFAVTCLGCADLEEVQANAAKVLAAKLIFIDINLGYGKASGIEVLHWLQANQANAKVYFLTGHANDHALVVSASATGAEILTKPLSPEALGRIVTTAFPKESI